MHDNAASPHDQAETQSSQTYVAVVPEAVLFQLSTTKTGLAQSDANGVQSKHSAAHGAVRLCLTHC